MKSSTQCAAVVNAAVMFGLWIAAGTPFAAQRTFVASHGVDTNPCSLAAPCRSFTQAVTQTSAYGEVIALDSAGYGPVTIGQSVSIMAAPGVYAGITASGGGNGVDVTGGTTVVLRGLSIGSLGSGIIGINANDATVTVEGCTISGFLTSGILAGGTNGQLHVRDTTFSGISYGIYVGSSGVTATVHRANFQGHSTAVFLSNGAMASISDSVFEDNTVGASIQAATGSTTTTLTISASVIHVGPSGAGITAVATSGGTVMLQASGNTISHGSVGVQVNGDAPSTAIASISENAISNNPGTGILVIGTNARATISRNTVSNNGAGGIWAGSGATLVASNNSISGNVGAGIIAQDAGTTITAAGNVVVDNADVGFHNDAPASLMSRGDNTLTGNAGGGPQTVGTITPIGGF